MLVTASQMKAAEEEAFCKGSTPVGLMEVAGEGIAMAIRQFFPRPGTLIVFCGKGHNAGDALVAARYLEATGWRVFVRCAVLPSEMEELTRNKLKLLSGECIVASVADVCGPILLLDGLLGIGARGAPLGPILGLIHEINQLRKDRGGFTVSVDIPSGLDATTGEVLGSCVQADLSVTLGAVKTGLVTDNATVFVGRISLVHLPGVLIPQADSAVLSTQADLVSLLPTRDFDSYKGDYGRIGIIAGSKGYLGAARLSSCAAVQAGGGLVTLYATPDCYDFLATSCIPEVMVHRVKSYREILEGNNNVLALGPGLGRLHDGDMRSIIAESMSPCVVDADALNALSTDVSILSNCAGPRLLTPHPGEMERLSPRTGLSRLAWAVDFTDRFPVTLLLKGSRTVVAERNCPPIFNSTGNPGMGTGGVGDVLTGVCAALIGGGHSPRNAAALGAWLCGRAAEIAIFRGCESQESLTASSIIGHIGSACNSLRGGDF